jgi:hypothetical protein
MKPMRASVELRRALLDGDTIGRTEMNAQVALALHPGDRVVLPSIKGCWVIDNRHVRVSDAPEDTTEHPDVYVTLAVLPREDI